MSKLKIRNGSTWEEIPAGGVGVPSGGTAGQILMKSSATDYADKWADISEAGAMSKWELLWTNASPTSAFAEQTVSLSLSGYTFVCIFAHSFSTSQTDKDGFIGIVGQPMGLQSNGRGYARYANITTTGVTFGPGYNGTIGVNQNNQVCVPYQIYGIKGVG